MPSSVDSIIYWTVLCRSIFRDRLIFQVLFVSMIDIFWWNLIFSPYHSMNRHHHLFPWESVGRFCLTWDVMILLVCRLLILCSIFLLLNCSQSDTWHCLLWWLRWFLQFFQWNQVTFLVFYWFPVVVDCVHRQIRDCFSKRYHWNCIWLIPQSLVWRPPVVAGWAFGNELCRRSDQSSHNRRVVVNMVIHIPFYLMSQYFVLLLNLTDRIFHFPVILRLVDWTDDGNNSRFNFPN